ncbi:hypothetical protein RJT34_12944 [Clitoria ternatea]|uniref:Uncharacterized protein n=1 Tax=Clitoria ternatea TaxID=43366 RepID=A0AAN9JMQ9_CLITE
MEEDAAYMKKLYEYGEQLNNAKDNSGEQGANRNNFLSISSNSTEVALSYEDGCPVEGNGVGRKVIDRVQETY